MNIGIYSPYLDTLTGGEKYIFTAAQALSSEHRVSIFWDDKSIKDKASEKFNLDLSNVSIVPNVFNNNVGIIRRLKATFKYDRVLYLSDGSIPVVACRKLLIHFQFPVEWVNTNSFPFLFKKSRIAKIICNSYFTKLYIDKKFKCDSSVLYPPAQTSTKSHEKKENVILTVGRYSIFPNGKDFKKLEIMAEAFKSLSKKTLKNWKFVIVTSVNAELENSFQEFEKRIKDANILIVKNARYKEITEQYAKSKIYWHAAGYGENLQKHPERAEHFGMSTVEAMSYGAVPIVISAGGQPEIVKNDDNGLLWKDIDGLTEETVRVVEDSELLARLSKRAIETSRNFNAARFSEELSHLIW